MKKLLLILTVFALTVSSCSRIDFGDINTDPTVPQEGNIDALMRGAMINFATNGGRVYYSNATLYAQYQSQTTYTQEQRYVQYKGGWYSYYVSQLQGLKEVANTESDIRGNTANMKAIAELMSVMIWKRVTDTFGDVPYTEALQGTANLTPAYTSQQEIYTDLLARAKAARNMLDASAFTPDANTDIFYGGDVDKWGKFANSFIMALSIQLSNTSISADAQAAFNEALTNSYGVIEDNADNMVFTPDVTGKSVNPISRSRAGDFNVSKEFTDALKGIPGPWGPGLTDPKNVTSNSHADARVQKYVTNGDDGLPYGYASYPGAAGSMNDDLDSENSPFTIFSAAYTYLNRAEAALIYSTGEDAATMMTEGIKASYTALGLTTAEADAYAALRVADMTAFSNEQVIGEEKWFALFPDGYAAWAEQRRTGWPALQPAPESTNGGVIPHRMLYPVNAQSVNPNGWAQGVQGLVPADDANTSKIWWE